MHHYYEVSRKSDKIYEPWSLTFYETYSVVICPECEKANYAFKDTVVDGFKCHKCEKIIIYPASWAQEKNSYTVMDGKTKEEVFEV
jgi:hypothetical protein